MQLSGSSATFLDVSFFFIPQCLLQKALCLGEPTGALLKPLHFAQLTSASASLESVFIQQSSSWHCSQHLFANL